MDFLPLSLSLTRSRAPTSPPLYKTTHRVLLERSSQFDVATRDDDLRGARIGRRGAGDDDRGGGAEPMRGDGDQRRLKRPGRLRQRGQSCPPGRRRERGE